MNGDGRFTISDVGLWLKYFLFLPGDYLIGDIVTNNPRLAEFFEMNFDWCHSFASLGVGLFGLFAVFSLFVGVVSAVRDIYHRWGFSKEN